MKRRDRARLQFVARSSHSDPNGLLEWVESSRSSDSSGSQVSPSSETCSMHQDFSSPASHLEQHLTQLVLASSTPQEALLKVTQAIGETFSVENCIIIPQSQTQECSDAIRWCAGGATAFAPVPKNLLSILNHPAIAPVWTGAEPLVIADLQALIPPSTCPAAGLSAVAATCVSEANLQVRAILAIRTESQGQMNGILVLARSYPHCWSEADVQRLKYLAAPVAIAISQTQLDQKVQRQIQYQMLIDQLTAAIRSNWSLNEIFQLAVEGTASALYASRGLLLLLKYADPLYKSRASAGLPKVSVNLAIEWLNSDQPEIELLSIDQRLNGSDCRPEPSFWASDCSLCQQILLGKAAPIVIPADHPLIPDEGHPLMFGGPVAPVFKLNSLPSVLLLPLENQGTILGCLVLQYHRRRLWLPEEIAFARLAAAQLSSAIIQSRTMQQIQAVVQERTAQLQRSLEVQAKLYEKTRQQVEQLRRLNQEREEFLSAISHELRTPLTSMTLAIRMLRETDLSPERRVKYLDILEQQCIQETNLINDLLALRKLETSPVPVRLQKLDVCSLIEQAVQSLAANWAEKNLNVVLYLPDRPLTICSDGDSLNRILLELLTNAGKYSEPGSTIQLTVEHQANLPVGQIVLTLCNLGAGIPPEELPQIFDKFRRGQRATQEAIQGTGLGLALVKRLVDHLNGTIAATSCPLEQTASWETCFTVILPQYPDEARDRLAGAG